MKEIKDKKLAQQIKENPISKQDFKDLLKKACKPKPSTESSKT